MSYDGEREGERERETCYTMEEGGHTKTENGR